MSSPDVLSPLEGAVLIGDGLCRGAHWDDEQRYCNWMGRSMTEVTRIDGPITPTTTALGPDLYSGSSGIALFLAQLFAITGDQACRRTALGAIGRSLWQITRHPSPKHWPSLALFNGHVGVAYAAARIGALTGDADLFAQVSGVLAQVAEAITAPHVLDVMGGNAGAIPALLVLSQEPGMEEISRWGRRLGRGAVPDRDSPGRCLGLGCRESWRRRYGPCPLDGFRAWSCGYRLGVV